MQGYNTRWLLSKNTLKLVSFQYSAGLQYEVAAIQKYLKAGELEHIQATKHLHIEKTQTCLHTQTVSQAFDASFIRV